MKVQWNGQQWVPVQQQGTNIGVEAAVTAIGAGIVTKVLVDSDVLIRNLGVKQRLDTFFGPIWNDFKAQWNAEFPLALITVPDYNPKDFE